MELLQLLNAEAIFNEKTPLNLSNEIDFVEYTKIENDILKYNLSVYDVEKAFELNRFGKLEENLFDKNSKKVVAYQKVGLRYVSEILFAYNQWLRYNIKSDAAFALPPPPPMSLEESYRILKLFVIDKYKKGETEIFKLATYLLDDFYELERANIDISEQEQKELVNEAEKWLKTQKEILMNRQGFSDVDIHRAQIDKRGAYSLAKRYVLADNIIKNHLMDEL